MNDHLFCRFGRCIRSFTHGHWAAPLGQKRTENQTVRHYLIIISAAKVHYFQQISDIVSLCTFHK
ncbi:hypothetical protein HMPREF1990_01221 [Porphyromonas gingivalis W4087]|nr:hypothetical protein HMPREF1554_01610 [Porphyromonas gingivalis F0569]ERJ88788.1 hypothetical protein HMPREF1990_01221 [Porphyromonas gingivalis W4087]